MPTSRTEEGSVPTSPALVVAAVQELLLALLFFVIPFVALAYGERAQRAAERDVISQGVAIDGDTLRRSGAQFSESRMEMLLPLGIGVVLVVAAGIALLGGSRAVIVTWVVEVLLLVVVGSVTYGQVFPAASLTRAWAKADDERLRRIDVDRMMRAAGEEFPRWLRPLQIARFGLATVGSLVVMLLLVIGV
jgi:hypothetical protein